MLYVSNFNAVNTSHIVTLLASGVGRSIRIARWIARSVLLVQNEVKAVSVRDVFPEFQLTFLLVGVLSPASNRKLIPHPYSWSNDAMSGFPGQAGL